MREGDGYMLIVPEGRINDLLFLWIYNSSRPLATLLSLTSSSFQYVIAYTIYLAQSQSGMAGLRSIQETRP